MIEHELDLVTADGLMNTNLSFVTDKQDGTGKDPGPNSFTENTCSRGGLVHKFRE